MNAVAVEAHARGILVRELNRRNRNLRSLPEPSRAAVREASERIVAALAEAIVELAEEEPAVAAAMSSIYGVYGLTEAAAAPPSSD